MSKLNPLLKRLSSFETGEQLAGGAGMTAARQDSYSLLRRVVLANLLWEKIAYVDGESVTEQIRKLIPLCTPKQVNDLAIEARELQKLRHTPLFIAVQMLKYPEHRKYVASLLPRIITRADMLTDFVTIYKTENDGKIKPLAHAAKKGLAKAFDNFNEYQFAKYDRNAAIKLRDVMFLVHPKAPQGKEELYKKIADRTLKTPDTWEVELSAGKDKRATWERLINEKKIGGLAMLRNIRNMMEASVPAKTIQLGLSNLKGAMLLPFDFVKSARINPEFKGHLEEVMLSTYAHLPKLPGRTLFIVDRSGSMGANVSDKSTFTRQEVAYAMAMLACNLCEDFSLVVTAGDDFASKHSSEWIKYPAKGFDIFEQMKDAKVGGGGIFTRQVLEWSKQNLGEEFDRIIVFSDSQDCDKQDKTPHPFAKYNYICDVSANKHGVNFKGRWTAEISGWSEHFLTYIAAYEGLSNQFQEEQ